MRPCSVPGWPGEQRAAQPIARGPRPVPRGQRAPDEDAAGQALRNAIEGRDQPAASLRDRLAAAFTWPHAAARLIEILAELHDEHGRPF